MTARRIHDSTMPLVLGQVVFISAYRGQMRTPATELQMALPLWKLSPEYPFAFPAFGFLGRDGFRIRRMGENQTSSCGDSCLKRKARIRMAGHCRSGIASSRHAFEFRCWFGQSWPPAIARRRFSQAFLKKRRIAFTRKLFLRIARQMYQNMRIAKYRAVSSRLVACRASCQ